MGVENPFAVPDAAPGTITAAQVEPPTPEAPTPDVAPKPSRPTTRAERRARAEANAAKKAGQTKDKKPAGTTPRKASLETRLAANLAGLGMALAAAGALHPKLGADGVLVIEQSPQIAAALSKVADQKPEVKAALERMLTAGVYSGLLAALLPLALGIAANHELIPPHLAAMLGAGTPTTEPSPGGFPLVG